MTLTPDPLVSVVLPIYNRSKYLAQAIESVFNQTYPNWELVLADDASDPATQSFLKKYSSAPKVNVHFNSHNLGLFANLNQAVRQSHGDYILLLCSDDFLRSDGIATGLNYLLDNPNAKLLLSAFEVVDAEDRTLPSGAAYYYNCFLSRSLQLLQPIEVLPLLLQYGSINGNLTGMFFTRSLYEQTGGFEERFRQVSDWEWLYRVAQSSPVLISKTPIATVRSHKEQLSRTNFKNLTNSLEVIEMVKLLLSDPCISKSKDCTQSALHTMQFQLWFALKFAFLGQWQEAIVLSQAIAQVTGLGRTFWSMLKWLPQRWRVYQRKSFPIPPTNSTN